jgi:hypothetical protein
MAERQHQDDDPPPTRSPRLYGVIESLAHARKVSKIRGQPIPAWKVRRYRMMLVIAKCREGESRDDRIPYSMLIGLLGISESSAKRYRKLGSACWLRYKKNKASGR